MYCTWLPHRPTTPTVLAPHDSRGRRQNGALGSGLSKRCPVAMLRVKVGIELVFPFESGIAGFSYGVLVTAM